MVRVETQEAWRFYIRRRAVRFRVGVRLTVGFLNEVGRAGTRFRPSAKRGQSNRQSERVRIPASARSPLGTAELGSNQFFVNQI
jgi:hypothetical protein